MVIIADLAAFCSDLVTPRFVDSSCLLCYTIDVIADNDHACFMRPEQAFYKLLYILVTIQKINREGEQALQIALCDDEITNHETVRELIRQYKQIHSDRTLSLSSFASGKELINHVDEHGCFDLYILDCIMPEMNGIELGAALRTRDDTGFLIYLTTSPDFALDSYRVDAFDYLLKPVESELFFQSLDKAYRSFSQIMQKTVAIKTTDSIRMIPIADIRYAERIDKHIDYHLTDNTVIHSTSFNCSFQNAVSELLSHKRMLLVGFLLCRQFIPCHRGYKIRSAADRGASCSGSPPYVRNSQEGVGGLLAEWRQILCFLRKILFF